MNEKSSGSGAIIAVVIIIIVAIVGWLAYNQGYFTAEEEINDNNSGLNIEIGAGGESNE